MSLTLACYKEILPAFACVVDKDGFIESVSPTGSSKPATISGAVLVLPTPANLRKGFSEEQFPFHPLCESMSRQGTSPAIQYLQRAAKAIISLNVVMLGQHLLELACDVSTHKDIPPDASDFLVKLADCDKDKNIKTVYEKVIAAATKKNRIATVYLKNGGTFNGVKVNRSCVIRIPLLEDLQQEGKDVLGVTVSKKQRKILTALFKLIVPFGDNPEEYSYGTVNRHAPYLQCLLVAYAKITKVINQCINNYAVPLHLPVKPIPTYDPKIVDTFEKARAEVEIPTLRGNEGGIKEGPEEADQTVRTPEQVKEDQVAARQTNTIPQNSRQAQPVPVAQTNNNGMASIDDFRRMNSPQPTPFQQQSFQQQPVQQQGLFGQPQQQPTLFGQPMQQQPAMFQQQPVNNGLPWQQQVPQQQQPTLFGQPQQQSMFGQPQQLFNNGPGNGLGLI